MKRKIIKIDEDKCNGCGLCIPNCAEGSLAIVDGKAKLVRDALCDGLGACLGHCPQDALILEEREAEEFDEELVEERMKEIAASEKPAAQPAIKVAHGGGCPSARLSVNKPAAPAPVGSGVTPSQLGQWPVQLGLLPPTAPFFKDADLVMAADCVPFAYPDFHRDFLTGKALAVACPKLDDADAHYTKLVELFKSSGVKSVTVLRMEVPCCGGLSGMVKQALEASGMADSIPYSEVIITRDGRKAA